MGVTLAGHTSQPWAVALRGQARPRSPSLSGSARARWQTPPASAQDSQHTSPAGPWGPCSPLGQAGPSTGTRLMPGARGPFPRTPTQGWLPQLSP